jgi:putative endonuclease
VARNWRCSGGELDLVMRKADTLVLVEVRKRSREDYGGAFASVTAAKRRRLIHAAKMFLAQHPQYAADAVRFDVVAVDADNKLEWLEAAFDAVE